MSQNQWIASCAIAFHLVALLTASVPDPRRLRPVTETPPRAGDSVSRALTPALDALARIVAVVEPVAYRLLTPLRLLSAPYIAAGVGSQQWNMFSNPVTFDQYVRVDTWLVGDDGGSERVVREVLLPADDELEMRGLHQFRDKAIVNAVENYDVALESLDLERDRGKPERAEGVARARRFLEPVVRWGANRAAVVAGKEERVSRAELWLGQADNPPPGESTPGETVIARLALLEPYHHGPRPVAGASVRRSEIGAVYRERDLSWTLLAVDVR